MTIHFTLVEPDQAAERSMAIDVDMHNKLGSINPDAPTLLERFYSDTETFEQFVYDCFGQVTGAPLDSLRKELAYVRDCRAAGITRGIPHADLQGAYCDLGRYFFNLIDSVARTESDVAEGK